MAQTRAQSARKRSMRKMYRKRYSACRGLTASKCHELNGCKKTKSSSKRRSYCRKSYSRRRRSSKH